MQELEEVKIISLFIFVLSENIGQKTLTKLNKG